ncbi:flagellar hook-associated protein FlgL [Tatumella terrea]|uniref:flagellin N-terminal helical domain-containing protein n=1 Tax=Tatumella terrea TaxID=419007 RepID=UPI0031D6B217
MRISSLSQPQWMLSALENGNSQIQKLSDQLSTQQKQSLPSEDPLNASRTAALTQQQAVTAQYQQNITTVTGSLSSQETLLTSINNQVLALQDQFRSMNNASHTGAENPGYAAQISSLTDGIVSLLNSQDANGHYLFAGTNNTQPPVVKVDGQYQWQGNDQAQSVQVGQQQWIAGNTTVGTLFSSGEDGMGFLNQLSALQTSLTQTGSDASPDSETLGDLIQQSSDISDRVSSAVASIGSRQNQLTRLTNVYTDLTTANSGVLSSLQSTDTAQTTLQLQSWLQTVEYSSKAYSLMNQFSLFDEM